jgi:hypothetical protein
MKTSIIAIAVSCVLLASSCNLTNSNDIFAKLDPSSPQYKNELIRHFLNNGITNHTFNFEGLTNIAGKDYMKVDISGGGIQAKILVLVKNWRKLEGIKRTKGLGYQGAELRDLQFDIVNTNGEPNFVYRDLAKIID